LDTEKKLGGKIKPVCLFKKAGLASPEGIGGVSGRFGEALEGLGGWR